MRSFCASASVWGQACGGAASCHATHPNSLCSLCTATTAGACPEFTVWRNAALSGHNTEHLKDQTVASCSEACCAKPWCKSFDYAKASRACDLSDKRAADAGGLKTNYAGNPFDHYDRPTNTTGKCYCVPLFLSRLLPLSPSLPPSPSLAIEREYGVLRVQ